MPANVFNVFMSEHPPVGVLVDHANRVLWDESALHPVTKERVRIALAETIGCSYCARFRTDLDGQPILHDADRLDDREASRAVLAERFAVAFVAHGDAPPDELTIEVQAHFSSAEFTDLVFTIGWFIGMQHVGRVMHWAEACPVAPIREMVEAGEAA